jgi:hypothetical protein
MRIQLPLLVASTIALSACATDPGHQHHTQPTAVATANAPAVSSTATAGLPIVDTAAAQRALSPDETLQTLDFPESGTKTLSGRIDGYKSVSYALPIRKGQRLEVTMDTKSTSAYFNIQDVKDSSGAALFAGEASGTNTALIRATTDTTYLLRPYLNRAYARRGSSADYTFKIERQ